MAKIPVTREDFIQIGERFPSEAIVAEIDRLLPIATGDIVQLASRGYVAPMLEQLRGFRTSLGAESSERRQNRGSKKAARRTEIEAHDAGVALLRGGTSLAIAAVSMRIAPEGETPEQTRKVITDLGAQIDTLSGPIAEDTATLRTRLDTLQRILANPELRPGTEMTAAITDCSAELRRSLESLPTATEIKEALQQGALLDTADLDEIDGRAYWNLKLLTQVGRRRFRELKMPEKAKPYRLTALTKPAKKPTTTTPTPPT